MEKEIPPKWKEQCSIQIKSANIHNTLPRPANSNGRFVLKLKRGFKYRGQAYFKPVHSHAIYQLPNYKKTLNSFYICNQEDVKSNEILTF